MLALILIFTQPAQAQTYRVIYNFTGAADGGAPMTGLTMDQAGNFYGTTSWGGSGGAGTVFKRKHTNSGWAVTTLYNFTGGDDGGNPQASLTIGPDGSLYGTTFGGGSNCGGSACGTVFRLQPSATAVSANWIETVIHRFTGSPDGYGPGLGKLVFDSAGNLYGTTASGGTNNGGTLYELTPSPSRSNWTESILYSFGGAGEDGSGGGGAYGVVADSAGNFYGPAPGGGYSAGSIYELSHSPQGWTLQNLYIFYNGFNTPEGGVILDPAGNLYGTTFFSNAGCCGNPQGGSVFSLTFSFGQWYIGYLHDFGSAPHGPTYSLLRDVSGNLYGTDNIIETLFELTYPSWSYTVLHNFSGGSDGGWPYGELISDAHGNVWGTAVAGGAYGNGVIWEITPSENSVGSTSSVWGVGLF